MGHPLNGSLAHIDRADEDFSELQGRLERFADEKKRELLADYDLKSIKGMSAWPVTGFRKAAPTDVPIECAVLVSAVIHHLRAALDYLIYELAIEDSGVIQEGTQFIIEDVKSDPKKPNRGFDARAASKLRGLSVGHVSAIEDLQPYKGVQWTETLRDISNPDKHRKLTAIVGQAVGSHRILVGWPGDFKGRPGQTLTRIGGGREIHIEADYSISIGFPEWNDIPVLETLDILKRSVRTTVESFKLEFKRIRI